MGGVDRPDGTRSDTSKPAVASADRRLLVPAGAVRQLLWYPSVTSPSWIIMKHWTKQWRWVLVGLFVVALAVLFAVRPGKQSGKRARRAHLDVMALASSAALMIAAEGRVPEHIGEIDGPPHVDPWGRPYGMEANEDHLEFRSAGEDGVWGTHDDIECLTATATD